MAFFQFLHNDFSHGMKVKNMIETITNVMQLFFYIAIIMIIVTFIYYPKYKYKWIIMYVVFVLYLFRFINPLSTNYGLMKAQKQQLF